MVERQSALKPRSGCLAVVDLDGTYLRQNSLRIFLRCALEQALADGKPTMVARLVIKAALRKLRLITHARMKLDMLSAIALADKLKDRFRARALACINPRIAAELDKFWNDGGRVLLATAAADMYVPLIWEGKYVATAMVDNPDRLECRGTRKLAAVIRYANDNNLRITDVFTDHADDLPLMANAGADRVVLVNPSAATIAAANMAGVKNLTVWTD